MFEDEEEIINEFLNNKLIDEENYNIALKEGLWKCRFYPVRQDAYQYASIDVGEELTKEGVSSKCDEIADILKSNFLSNENNSFDEEKWIAQAFTTIKIIPIKYGTYEYDDDEYHTNIIVKIVYEYNVDFSRFLENIEDRPFYEVSNEVSLLKTGLQIFLENTIEEMSFDDEPGVLAEIINQRTDEANCYFSEINTIGEPNIDDLIESSDAYNLIDF